MKDTLAETGKFEEKSGLGDIAYTLQKVSESGKVCADLGERLCNDVGQDTDIAITVEDQLATVDQLTGNK